MNYWEKTKVSFDLLVFRSLVEIIEEKKVYLADVSCSFFLSF